MTKVNKMFYYCCLYSRENEKEVERLFPSVEKMQEFVDANPSIEFIGYNGLWTKEKFSYFS